MIELALVFLVGLIFGSFATLVSYRLPREENIITGRSRCPSCEHTLGVLALAPLFSWLFQGGKCRYCKTPISARYPLTEIMQGLLFVCSYLAYGITPLGIILALLSLCLLIMSVIDFEWYILPDELQVICAILGIGYQFLLDTDLWVVLSNLSIGISLGLSLHYGYYFIRKKNGLGWGDVKFLAVAALWFQTPYDWVGFLFFSGLIGIMIGIIWRLLGKGERFPFGPALALSLFFVILFPIQQQFFNFLTPF